MLTKVRVFSTYVVLACPLVEAGDVEQVLVASSSPVKVAEGFEVSQVGYAIEPAAASGEISQGAVVITEGMKEIASSFKDCNGHCTVQVVGLNGSGGLKFLICHWVGNSNLPGSCANHPKLLYEKDTSAIDKLISENSKYVVKINHVFTDEYVRMFPKGNMIEAVIPPATDPHQQSVSITLRTGNYEMIPGDVVQPGVYFHGLYHALSRFYPFSGYIQNPTNLTEWLRASRVRLLSVQDSNRFDEQMKLRWKHAINDSFDLIDGVIDGVTDGMKEIASLLKYRKNCAVQVVGVNGSDGLKFLITASDGHRWLGGSNLPHSWFDQPQRFIEMTTKEIDKMIALNARYVVKLHHVFTDDYAGLFPKGTRITVVSPAMGRVASDQSISFSLQIENYAGVYFPLSSWNQFSSTTNPQNVAEWVHASRLHLLKLQKNVRQAMNDLFDLICSNDGITDGMREIAPLLKDRTDGAVQVVGLNGSNGLTFLISAWSGSFATGAQLPGQWLGGFKSNLRDAWWRQPILLNEMTTSEIDKIISENARYVVKLDHVFTDDYAGFFPKGTRITAVSPAMGPYASDQSISFSLQIENYAGVYLHGVYQPGIGSWNQFSSTTNPQNVAEWVQASSLHLLQLPKNARYRQAINELFDLVFMDGMREIAPLLKDRTDCAVQVVGLNGSNGLTFLISAFDTAAKHPDQWLGGFNLFDQAWPVAWWNLPDSWVDQPKFLYEMHTSAIDKLISKNSKYVVELKNVFKDDYPKRWFPKGNLIVAALPVTGPDASVRSISVALPTGDFSGAGVYFSDTGFESDAFNQLKLYSFSSITPHENVADWVRASRIKLSSVRYNDVGDQMNAYYTHAVKVFFDLIVNKINDNPTVPLLPVDDDEANRLGVENELSQTDAEQDRTEAASTKAENDWAAEQQRLDAIFAQEEEEREKKMREEEEARLAEEERIRQEDAAYEERMRQEKLAEEARIM